MADPPARQRPARLGLCERGPRLTLYLDSSAIVKLFVAEPGTRTMVDALADAPTLHAAQITYVEVHSALARMLKGARLEADEHDEKRSGFEAFWRDVARVEIDEELVVGAARLATAHGLRGYDAVQLAAAKRVAAAEALAFASWDSELVRAGEREGLTMLPDTT